MKYWDKRTSGPIKALHPMTNKVIEVNPQQDVKISSDYTKELLRLPALLSWYMSLRDRAETRLREAKHLEHCAEEDVYDELRSKNSKGTETTIKMAVRKDQRMRKAFRERMDAEDMHEKLKSAVEAVAAKKWVLSDLIKSAVMERGTRDNA